MTPLESFLAKVDRKVLQLAPPVIKAFLEGVTNLRNSFTLAALEDAIAAGNVDEAIRLVLGTQVYSEAMLPLRDAIRQAYIESGRFYALDARPLVAVRFDVLHPEVVQAIRSYEGQQLLALQQDMQAGVRAAIEAGLAAGQNPKVTARALRGILGLSAHGEQAVRNFEAELRAGDWGALQRALRDKRFDGPIRRALEAGLTPTEAQITRYVDAYRKRYIAFEADTLSRTLTLQANKDGQRLVWEQAIRDGKVSADELTKTWRTAGDSRVRPTHQEMEGVTVAFTEPWMVPGVGAQDTPGQDEFNCFPGSTRVASPDGIVPTIRVFDGETVTLYTAAGHELTCTPNHPVLTPRGWIAAKFLHEGSEIVHSLAGHWQGTGRSLPTPDCEHVPAPIKEVAETLLLGDKQMWLREVKVSAKDFHGDASDGDVAVVGSYRGLSLEGDGCRFQQSPEVSFTMRLSEADALAGRSGLKQRAVATDKSPSGGVRRRNLPLPGLASHSRPLKGLGFGSAANGDPGFSQLRGHVDPADGELLGNRIDGSALAVQLREDGLAGITTVLRVGRRQFHGDVYNLETERGWYIAEGVIVHNCRCLAQVRVAISGKTDARLALDRLAALT